MFDNYFDLRRRICGLVAQSFITAFDKSSHVFNAYSREPRVFDSRIIYKQFLKVTANIKAILKHYKLTTKF